jgi:hypothetical protein
LDAKCSAEKSTNFIRSLTLRVLVKTAVVAALSWSIPLVGGKAGQTEKAVETIVFIRHGEKPEGGFGQLNCQGLNRALALAPIIAKSFGRPDAIFAPNPSHPKEDAGRLYDWVGRQRVESENPRGKRRSSGHGLSMALRWMPV